MPGETPVPAARYEDTDEWAVWVLAEQVSASGPLAPQAIELIAESDRAFLRCFFCHLSHHIHYSADPKQAALKTIRDQVTARLREQTAGDLRPGDWIEITGAFDHEWIGPGDRMIVRFVGNDGTLDAEVDPGVDYGIARVPLMCPVVKRSDQRLFFGRFKLDRVGPGTGHYLNSHVEFGGGVLELLRAHPTGFRTGDFPGDWPPRVA